MVSAPNTPRPSGTIDSPLRTSWNAGLPVMSAPAYRTLPDLTGCRPVMPLSVVVLPAPLAPIRQTSSPGADLQVDPLDRLDATVSDLQTP